MIENAPILVWFRRGDLRLSDNPALGAAVEMGRPVLPIFVRDTIVDGLGAAPRWRLEKSLDCLAKDLSQIGSRLILRSGQPVDVISRLIEETGASTVLWNRSYDPASRERDTALKAQLKQDGIDARSFSGNLLFEPWHLKNKQGQPYKVFSPLWRAQWQHPVAEPLSRPVRIPAMEHWPNSEHLEDWGLARQMGRGAAVLGRFADAGENAAQDRLQAFLETSMVRYQEGRDEIGAETCSGLSAFLANGEISARQIWHSGLKRYDEGNPGAMPFLRQLVWREFSWNLLFHWPHLANECWRPEWEGFSWNRCENRPEIRAWKRGRTGVELVDAGMREMMVTGSMHNRARMVVASYLTKHLMADWRIGRAWFEQHLVDWDEANNAVGWQWVAGCGPDAAPYFRIFNPDTQAKRYDAGGLYRRKWIAEGQASPPETALAFFEASPAAWGLSAADAYPSPVVGLEDGRRAALTAHERFRNLAPV